MRQATAPIEERIQNQNINYEGRKLIRQSIQKYDFIGSELYLPITICFGSFLFFSGGAVAQATVLISEITIASSLQWYMVASIIMLIGVVLATIFIVAEIRRRRNLLLHALEAYVDCTADNESRVLPYLTKES
jgi:hypothetical protein